MDDALLKAAVTVLCGAVAGGLTNTVAIWMLFHPHRPPAVRGLPIRWLQGAVPKNQARLAKAIGRTVGSTLLTPADLAGVLGRREFRDAFEERLARFLDDVLEVERGSVRDLLGPDAMAAIDDVLDDFLNHAMDRVDDYLASAAFETAVRSRADDLAAFAAGEPVNDLLTPERVATVGRAVQEWVGRVAAEEAFRESVAAFVRRAGERLLAPGVTLRDVLPPGAAGTLERAGAAFVPLAIGRLGSVLEKPEPRRRFESAIQGLLHRFLGDLKFHQRVVARLVVTEDAVAKALDAFEEEGAARVSEMFRDPAVRAAMATGIGDAISDFLDRPVRDALGDADDASTLDAQGAVVSWLVDLARSPATAAFATGRVEAALLKVSERTWGQVLDGVSPERAARWVVRAARSDAARAIARESARRIVAAALERPIGRPARLLPEGAAERIRRAAGPPLWSWLQGQAPALARRLDVAARVERKVLDFPVAKLEDLVRRVTERELRTIVYLGYGLGALIGLVLVAVDRLLG